ncbi:MAG: sugar transferase [Verrucomicrobiota bacterium]
MHYSKFQSSGRGRGECLAFEVNRIAGPADGLSNSPYLNHRRSVPPVSTVAARVPLWKRVLDVTCILLAVPILVPVALAIIAVIKIGSRGPVLFKQERVGLRGQSFTIFKFRTMTNGADARIHEAHCEQLISSDAPMVKLDAKGDSRLIPGGRLLRAAGLDELAQLLNVLRGEMSLVGPRPCLPAEAAQYLPWHRERFMAVPGLTGLWQVSGKNKTTFSEMMDLDIAYARNPSLGLDLKIMLKTFSAVVQQVREMPIARHSLN